jgi:hypothetical protein
VEDHFKEVVRNVRVIRDDYKALLKENILLTMVAHNVDLETAKNMKRHHERNLLPQDTLTLKNLEREVHDEL